MRFLVGAGYVIAVAALILISLTLILTLMSTAAKLHIEAKVVSVKTEAAHFGYRACTITVQYRSSNGREVTRSFEETRFSVPSAGDSMTILIGPFGAMEANPFPKMWFVTAALYAFFFGMIRFLTWCRVRFSGTTS